MGKATEPPKVKLITGLLARHKKLFDEIEEFFVARFGRIDYKSPVLRFDYTNYYSCEMGQSLKRIFISYEKLISPEKITEIKISANKLEKKFSVSRKDGPARLINIDPGYINDSKLVLATTKDYYHRIYLDRGIFAEVTLRWRKGGFEPMEWTYPDYATDRYRSVLQNIRKIYMEQRES